MKKAPFLLSALFSATFIFAQREIPAFGKVEAGDLQMTSCSFEPGASAMKLFDVQDVDFDLTSYNTKVTTEKRVRIKIFNEKGYEHATIRIPYYSKKRVSRIKDLNGVVYNLGADGKIIARKLEKKDFFKDNAADNVGMIHFTFPDLKPGSIIEFSYTKVDKNVLYVEPWIIQDDIPTAYTSAIITVPDDLRVEDKLYGTDTFEMKRKTINKGDLRWFRRTYFKENIRSFEHEPFMSSRIDNKLRMVFMLVPTRGFMASMTILPSLMWSFVGTTLMESKTFGGQLTKKIPGTEALVDSAKKINSVFERLQFIYKAVQERVPEQTEQTLYPDDVAEAWEKKSANSAEANLILINLLKKADIPCSPLLISTRDNGKVNTDFPSISQLNGVDALVQPDSNTLYVMDASQKYQLYQNTPYNVMNREGYLLAEEERDMKWIKITDNRPLIKQHLNIIATVTDSGTLEGSATYFFYNHSKAEMLDSSHKDEDDDDKFFDEKPAGLKILSVKEEGTKNDTDPLARTIEFSYELQNTGDFYFINPKFLFAETKSPFIKDIRYSDIDFGCNQQHSFMLNLSISSSYQAEQVPKSIIVRSPDSVFFFQRLQSHDSTRIMTSQMFKIEGSYFDKESYDGIKDFFTQVFAMMTEEIILKKRNP
jgi:hypothetical protein